MNSILKLAKELERKFADTVSDDSRTQLFASAIVSLKALAASEELSPVDDLHTIAALADAFDRSGDPELQAEAEAIDNILFAIAAPKAALAKINMVYDKELETLRDVRRKQEMERKYEGVTERLHEMHGHKAIADAVDEQVKVKRPMEEPLSTRYSPDRPGVQLMRITDHVYQDPTTGKIYDYEAGYKTDKGNTIPGGSLQQQTRDFGDYKNESIFSTRESLSAQASDENLDLKKKAQVSPAYKEIASKIQEFKRFVDSAIQKNVFNDQVLLDIMNHENDARSTVNNLLSQEDGSNIIHVFNLIYNEAFESTKSGNYKSAFENISKILSTLLSAVNQQVGLTSVASEEDELPYLDRTQLKELDELSALIDSYLNNNINYANIERFYGPYILFALPKYRFQEHIAKVPPDVLAKAVGKKDKFLYNCIVSSSDINNIKQLEYQLTNLIKSRNSNIAMAITVIPKAVNPDKPMV